MPSRSELERVWAETYKKALSRGHSVKIARRRADAATAQAREHGGEGPLRGTRTNKRVEKIREEQIRRARAAEEARSNAPEEFILPEEHRKRLLQQNREYARRWANRLTDVTPMSRLKLQNSMLKRLNASVDAQVKKFAEPAKVPFERYLQHQETTNKVAETLAKRLAGETQWKNWTQSQREEAIKTAYYWEERIQEYRWGGTDAEMRMFTPEMEAKRRLSEASLRKEAGLMNAYEMKERGEFGWPDTSPNEKTPYMSAKEMDRAIFRESVGWTGAKIGAAGAAVKGGAKTAAKWGGRALARLGSGAVAGPAGMIAMGALTGWDVGNMIYGTAQGNLGKMKGAQWPGIQAGVASIAGLGNMLVNSGIAKPIDLSESERLREIEEPVAELLDEIHEGKQSAWSGDEPVGFGPISDWNDMVDTVLGNITGQGIEGEPDPQTANEIVETWAKAYEGELKKEERDTGVESASPGDWFGSAGWDWANQMAQDKPAEAIADAFDPWTQFNPRDQSSLEAHGADIGRGLGGSADEELKELMAQTSFLQKIAENTKEDEIAVLGT